MPPEDDWEEPDPDSLMRSERKHEWISEPRYKRMFDDIEHALQGGMGKGPFEGVDRRVFDQVFDRSTLLAVLSLAFGIGPPSEWLLGLAEDAAAALLA